MANDSEQTAYSSPSGSQEPLLPLAFVEEGKTVKVAKLRGAAAMRQHLSELGFAVGAEVEVLNRSSQDMIVSVKGVSFGIRSDLAMKIMTA